MEQINQSYRTIFLDYLRVFATFSVMILHVASQNWYAVDIHSFEWKVFNFFDSITRWSVPVFIMISGSLFLDRDIPVKKMYSKYILRLVIAFVVWSGIYALFADGNVSARLSVTVQGHYHMYFLFLIVGLYMCVPLIRAIVEKDSHAKYYLLLSFTFAFLIPSISTLIHDFGKETAIKVMDIFNRNVGFMSMYLVLGYTGFFILGHMIKKTESGRIVRMIIYVLGILGFIATYWLENAVVLKTQNFSEHYYGHTTLNVLFEALAVFTWFRYGKFDRMLFNGFVQKLAKYSFGAYLIHAFVIEVLNNRLKLNTLSFNPIASVICIGIFVCIVSFAVSALLNQIPVVKKYIV